MSALAQHTQHSAHTMRTPTLQPVPESLPVADHVSSVAFDSVGQFATCQESLNDYEGQMMPNFFMGRRCTTRGSRW